MTTTTALLADSSPPDPLDPLSRFFEHDDPAALEWQEVEGSRVPEPYRGLLVHDGDMTSTLETFHRETLELRLLEKRRVDQTLLRSVVLIGSRTGRPLELGAIRIDLAAFAPDARWAILEGRMPLGAILARYDVAYVSRPRLFFQITSDARFEEELEIARQAGDDPFILFGRQNVLSDPAGRTLAEVVEILPPAPAASPGPRPD